MLWKILGVALMRQNKDALHTLRRTTELLKKAGIWIFLACFVASVVGVALVTIGR